MCSCEIAKVKEITEVEKSLAVITSKLDILICAAIQDGNRNISGSPTLETGSLIPKEEIVGDSKYVSVSN